jgi:hypothetical protein
MKDKVVREQWLRDAVTVLARELFKPNGYTLPDHIQVAVGWPGGRGRGSERIGECWAPQCSAGGHYEIFISPVLSDPSRVIDVLIHELVHVIAGHDAGHKSGFKTVAVKVGLEGKMTATVASKDLEGRIAKWLKELPKFPHDALTPGVRPGKKQSTRLIKCECPGCGYVVRTTQKWLDTGNPICPCGSDMTPDGAEPDEE